MAPEPREQEAADAMGDHAASPSAPVRATSPRPRHPQLSQLPGSERAFHSHDATTPTDAVRSPLSTGDPHDRVFPIRSFVTVDPTPTQPARPGQPDGGYFASARRASVSNAEQRARAKDRRESQDASATSDEESSRYSGKPSSRGSSPPQRQSSNYINEMMNETASLDSQRHSDNRTLKGGDRPRSARAPSAMSDVSSEEIGGGLLTARFKHVIQEGGHAVITGRDGETLQRCEDEPIHIPGAVQGFGLLIALEEQPESKFLVRVVSENSKRIVGYTPKQLFALESFTDILSEEQTDNLLDHVDFIRDEDADLLTNGPEVFTMAIRTPSRKNQKLWCAMHINVSHPNLIICEFELEEDPQYPLVPPNSDTPEPPEDTLGSDPTAEEYHESTHNSSKPLRVLRSARKRKGEAAAMEVFNIMSQVQEQLAAATNLEKFLKILCGVVKELTGFHRVMVYQFDQAWNGRVVTELVDPRATKDLYKGLNFPASDIPKQARDLYKINKVRMLYDRDLTTARLVCRTLEDLETPLDLTHSYLRAMSPIHLKYLANMAVRSSMSISINAFDELWGLIACHSYGAKGMRVSFPIRKMCRLVGDSASRNIERLSYASRLQARKLINTVPTSSNPSGYIIASSEDLLKLFDADFGLLSIRDETKILGHLEQSQEALAMLEYLRMRNITNVLTSLDINDDFPDLRYPPGFKVIAGLLLVPLSTGGQDFIVFFRKGQLKEVKWAGNPYEKFIKEGTEGYLEPRKSFRTWSETVVGKCREWTEEEVETAAVLCLVYGKFIEVWRQKEAALQNSQLTRLLLANSAHEVRTPLNAIINYLEIALEGALDQETRDNLAKSHSASKSLVYVINDLLDLTKTEEGGDLIKDEIFDVKATLAEATDAFRGDAKRKNISYEVTSAPGLPGTAIGDQRRVRQAIANITANAIQNTTEGGVTVEMYVASREGAKCELEVSVTDTGIGMNSKKLDQLFRELEQVQTEAESNIDLSIGTSPKPVTDVKKEKDRALGLGLAVVARIVRNMNGQLRLKSEEGKGSRFVIQFPFDLPDSEPQQLALEGDSTTGSTTPQPEDARSGNSTPSSLTAGGEVTLIERGSGSAARRQSIGRESHPSMSRKNSGGSINSRRSMGSMRSANSNMSYASTLSDRSEADRLIEAIQEPHRLDHRPGSAVARTGSSRTTAARPLSTGSPERAPRPKLEKRHTSLGAVGVKDDRSRAKSLTELTQPIHPTPGSSFVTDQATPIRAVRMPDEGLSPSEPSASQEKVFSSSGLHLGGLSSHAVPAAPAPSASLSPERMRVLVAEDDPLNSRIIQKRLQKLNHEVHLTVNGEECSSAYCERSDFFDIVLMDMQMPIVDGLTSTKMIRSFEKSDPSALLSSRASLNGRVPIIAVSASLIEKERQIYIDAGFDGWILKPISFSRLTSIMNGIVERETRKENLYAPGNWEHGGWFDEAQKDVFAAETRPSEGPPLASAPGAAGASREVKAAVADDDPFYKEEGKSLQSREQIRLAAEQANENEAQGERKTQSLPGFSSKFDEAGEEDGKTTGQAGWIHSPQPMTPEPDTR